MAAAQTVAWGAGGDGAGRAPARRQGRWDVGVCCLLFAALCGRQWLLQAVRWHSLHFVDDAYYYFVAARNVAGGHGSSFDGFTRTNGYHPLWLGMLALQYTVVGQSPAVTKAVEYALGLGTLATLLATARLPSLAGKLVFTLGLYGVLTLVGFNGMETTLFAFCVGMLCWAGLAFGDAGRHPAMGAVVMGLAATAAIGARIDAAVFVLPQLLLTVRGVDRKGWALGVVSVAGAVYAGVNRAVFGAMFPISGEVKSLGGLQWNRPLVRQLLTPGMTSALFWVSAALWLLMPLALRSSKAESAPGRALRGLQRAYLIGLPVYLLRLLCFSSWLVWSWYGYCLVLGYAACAPALLRWAEAGATRMFAYKQILAAVCVALALKVAWSYGRVFYGPAPMPDPGYFAVNHEALRAFGGVLRGARAAMGDRAGEFAYAYAGGVNQMEGIMNDKAYFDTLREGGDVQALLCARGVQYVVAYEPDLGRYERTRVETIRSHLSQFPAPALAMRREDEVGRVADLAKFNASMGDADVYLYLWRLPCEEKAHPPR